MAAFIYVENTDLIWMEKINYKSVQMVSENLWVGL